jgi:hypothetical protein
MKNFKFLAIVIAGCIALAMAFFGSSTKTTEQIKEPFAFSIALYDDAPGGGLMPESNAPLQLFAIVYDDYFDFAKPVNFPNKGLANYNWHPDKRKFIRQQARSNC